MTDPSAPIRRPANGASGQQAAHGGSASGTRGQTLQGRSPSRGQFAALSMWSGDYPEGGVADVLSRMAELAREGAARPAVQQVALEATEHLPPDSSGHANRKDRRAVARAVYEFVLGAVAYRHDDHGVEQLQTPLASVRIGAGDCDDMAVLAAALLKSLGVPTRFRAIATDAAAPHAYTHVYCQYQDGLGKWRSCDPVGNPGPDAIIAKGRVENELTHALSGGKQGPQEIAVLSASDLSGAGQQLAGVPDVPEGAVINAETVALRLVKPAEEPGQSFFVDTEVYRALDEWFGEYVTVVSAWTQQNDLLASATVDADRHPWHWEDYAHGTVRLVFPADFTPTAGPVVFKAHDAARIEDVSTQNMLGASEPLHLTDEALYSEPFESWWGTVGEQISDSAGSTRSLIERALTVGTVAAGGIGLAAAWPYVERVFPDFTEEDD